MRSHFPRSVAVQAALNSRSPAQPVARRFARQRPVVIWRVRISDPPTPFPEVLGRAILTADSRKTPIRLVLPRLPIILSSTSLHETRKGTFEDQSQVIRGWTEFPIFGRSLPGAART